MTETDSVTYPTIGSSITISLPEQHTGSSRSGSVNILGSMDPGPGDSDSRSRPRPGSPVPVSPQKQSWLVEEEMEDASGSLLEDLGEKGAGCGYEFHLTLLLLTHQSIIYVDSDVRIKERGLMVFRNLES